MKIITSDFFSRDLLYTHYAKRVFVYFDLWQCIHKGKEGKKCQAEITRVLTIVMVILFRYTLDH